MKDEQNVYRVFYWEYYEHRGQEYRRLNNEIYSGKLKNYPRKNSIYYLTDINGNVIIDNRKGDK